jgi:hypothetical protein
MCPSSHDKEWKNRLASVGRGDKTKTNDNGSVDLHLSPEGKASNWFQTDRGEGFFATFRLHGAECEFYDERLQVLRLGSN